MPLKDFISKKDGDLDEQETNFVAKFATIGLTLGFLPAEITANQTVLEAHQDAYHAMVAKKAEAKAAVAENERKKSEAIAELRRIAKKIKGCAAYTEAIGKDLQIIGPDAIPPDLNFVKPTLKGVLSGGVVVIEFDKQEMEGVKIYSKRGGETAFTFLGIDTHSPYHDNRVKLDPTKPEERQYYAFYFANDYEVGQQSDIVTVVVP
ncbi:MAG: hypothetical protein AB2L26_10385 [Ignavibacteria bacterium]